jgi:hypothetical protein
MWMVDANVGGLLIFFPLSSSKLFFKKLSVDSDINIYKQLGAN